MPLIEMKFIEGVLSADEKANLARKITELVVKEAKQPKEYTWVVIHEIPAEGWMFGGLTLSELSCWRSRSEKKT